VPNPYDPCVFNKQDPDSEHVTVLMHVLITSKRNRHHARFEKCMCNKYKELNINIRKVVDYIGMTFDTIISGQVSITMDNCERAILSECGLWPLRVIPADSTIFDTLDALKATYEEVIFFRTGYDQATYASPIGTYPNDDDREKGGT